MLSICKKTSAVDEFNTRYGIELELLHFIEFSHIWISSYDHLVKGCDNYKIIYFSEARSTTSRLDCCKCSFMVHSVISEMYIIDKLPGSDHLPITGLFTLIDGSISSNRKAEDKDTFIVTHLNTNWSKGTVHDIRRSMQGVTQQF